MQCRCDHWIWPVNSLTLRHRLDLLYVLVRQTELMADFVDQDVAVEVL